MRQPAFCLHLHNQQGSNASANVTPFLPLEHSVPSRPGSLCNDVGCGGGAQEKVMHTVPHLGVERITLVVFIRGLAEMTT